MPLSVSYAKTLSFRELRRIERREGSHAEARLEPARGVDIGAGPDEPVRRTLRGGTSGLVLDGRARRPFAVPMERGALELYPMGPGPV